MAGELCDWRIMFHSIDLLDRGQLAQLAEIGNSATFVDGRISNPHSKVKNNLQMGDAQSYQKSSQILFEALMASPEFHDCAFPIKVAPPLMTRYRAGMHYGLHPDAAIIPLPGNPLRSDLSCTIFLNDPDSYAGGALRIMLGNAELRFKGQAGQAIVYPSNSLHEVEPVEGGERQVAITFIQSRIADVARRELLFELNEVSALEGNRMSASGFTRLQSVQYNLARMWFEN